MAEIISRFFLPVLPSLMPLNETDNSKLIDNFVDKITVDN